MYNIQRETGPFYIYTAGVAPPTQSFVFPLNLKTCVMTLLRFFSVGWDQVEFFFFFHLPPSHPHHPTPGSRMLVFIDGRGFFYCLASNNALCWWGVIFIARTPVCTARKGRIWPEVATIVHSPTGLWLATADKHKHARGSCAKKKKKNGLHNGNLKMQRITLKKDIQHVVFFIYIFFFCRRHLFVSFTNSALALLHGI